MDARPIRVAPTPAEVVYSWFSAVVGLASIALAALVLFGSPRRRANVALVLVLIVTGLNALFYFAVWSPSLPVAWLVPASQAVVDATAISQPVAYVLFFTAALATPLVRPFQVRWVRAVLWLLFGCTVGLGLLAWAKVSSPEILTVLENGLYYGSLLYSSLASLDAWRRTRPGTPKRRRAALYLQSFLVMDVAQLIFTVTSLMFDANTPEPNEFINNIVGNLIFLVSLALLTRALLREQLFDFDLKVKFAIKSSTLGGIFLAVFFIVAQLVQAFFSQNGINWAFGGVAAGLLLFALRPLERLASRVADKAMPKTQNDTAYVQDRKQDVYRAAFESANEDGRMTDKERRTLDILADSLGLTVRETHAIERAAAAT